MSANLFNLLDEDNSDQESKSNDDLSTRAVCANDPSPSLIEESLYACIKQDQIGPDFMTATTIYIKNCHDITTLPESAPNAIYLEIVDCPNIKRLPRTAPNLKTLIIRGKNKFLKIPDSYTRLQNLKIEFNDQITSIPNEVAASLTSLRLEKCINFTVIGDQFADLKTLSVKECRNLTGISAPALDSLYIEDNTLLQWIPKSMYKTLMISNCPNALSTIF